MIHQAIHQAFDSCLSIIIIGILVVVVVIVVVVVWDAKGSHLTSVQFSRQKHLHRLGCALPAVRVNWKFKMLILLL